MNATVGCEDRPAIEELAARYNLAICRLHRRSR
jgi:hypothetical protein